MCNENTICKPSFPFHAFIIAHINEIRPVGRSKRYVQSIEEAFDGMTKRYMGFVASYQRSDILLTGLEIP